MLNIINQQNQSKIMESNNPPPPTNDSKAEQTSKVPVEDLPLSERNKLAEACNPFEGIAPGWLIDAKDTVDNWCLGNVLRVDSGDVQVNYDGWSSKYDFVSC